MKPPTPQVWRVALRDSDLGRTAKLVGFVLSTYANSRTSECFPSIATLASGASLSAGRHAATRAIDELEHRGFVTVKRSRGRGAHRYRLTLPPTAHAVLSSEEPTAHGVSGSEGPTAHLIPPTAHSATPTAHLASSNSARGAHEVVEVDEKLSRNLQEAPALTHEEQKAELASLIETVGLREIS